eukprot:CAMPEP_0118927786 /NCGR_PEP_ID=MMETSP1169-20130426/5189_1 /TAXON_ID=36882 /ORGANISM="Pyramimonas obovata, Strain CCMP722" /LENGTH=299 /DNA_ID=CAMNT_0006869629 /DNA_START=293 /DNA_END=1192 /DNA_ORIENTATION=-
MFLASGKSSKDVCLKLCENVEECSICHDSVPFFSFCGAESPEYYVFGVGLTIAAIIALLGIEEVNRMYFRLGELSGSPREPSFLRCFACSFCCCIDHSRRPSSPNQLNSSCTLRPHVPYMLKALRPVGNAAHIALPMVAWINVYQTWAFRPHALAAYMVFGAMSTYHVLTYLLQRDLLVHHPDLAAASLGLHPASRRFRVKLIWILALVALGVMNEVTKWVTPRTYWEDFFGPLGQWTAILGTIMVAMVHSLDLRHYLKHEGALIAAAYDLEEPVASDAPPQLRWSADDAPSKRRSSVA